MTVESRWFKSCSAGTFHYIHEPTVLVFRAKDPALGRKDIIARWQRSFPNVTLDRLGRAGHFIQREGSEEIVGAIRAAYGQPDAREGS